MKPLSPYRSQRSGQIIVVAPVLILILVLSMMLAVNIGNKTSERVEFQAAVDSSARTGAYTQGMLLGSIAILNDFLELGVATILNGISKLDDPLTWPAAIKDIVDGYKLIRGAWKLQDKIKDYSGIITAASTLDDMFVSDDFHMKMYSLALPVPGIKLDVDRVVLPMLRNWRGDIGETVLVVGYRVYDPPLIDIPFIDHGAMDEAGMLGVAAARPLCKFWSHDPLSDSLSQFYALLVMEVPGPWWSAKLIDFEKAFEQRLESSAITALEGKAFNKIKSYVTKQATKDAAEGEGDAEWIEMDDLTVDKQAEEDAQDDE